MRYEAPEIGIIHLERGQVICTSTGLEKDNSYGNIY